MKKECKKDKINRKLRRKLLKGSGLMDSNGEDRGEASGRR